MGRSRANGTDGSVVVVEDNGDDHHPCHHECSPSLPSSATTTRKDESPEVDGSGRMTTTSSSRRHDTKKKKTMMTMWDSWLENGDDNPGRWLRRTTTTPPFLLPSSRSSALAAPPSTMRSHPSPPSPGSNDGRGGRSWILATASHTIAAAAGDLNRHATKEREHVSDMLQEEDYPDGSRSPQPSAIIPTAAKEKADLLTPTTTSGIGNGGGQHQRFVYVMSSLIAGVGSGALASIICAPMDLVRTRMQVMGGLKLPPRPSPPVPPPPAAASSKAAAAAAATATAAESTVLQNPKAAMSITSHLRQIIATDGYGGCFRGLGATLATVPSFWGLYFPLYEDLKRRLGSIYRERQREREDVENEQQGGRLLLQMGDRMKEQRQQVEEEEWECPPVVHMASAMLAGAAADVVCNPMFVVRTRMQTEALHILEERAAAMSAGQKLADLPVRPVLSIRETVKALYVEGGGIPIFFRGLTASFIGLSHVGIQFPVYEFLKKEARKRSSNSQETPLDLLVASGLSKVCASFVSYPHEVIRSRMMDARGAEAGRSIVDTAKHVVAAEGYAGLYSGLHVALIRVVPNCCITFMTYELFLRWARETVLREK